MRKGGGAPLGNRNAAGRHLGKAVTVAKGAALAAFLPAAGATMASKAIDNKAAQSLALGTGSVLAFATFRPVTGAFLAKSSVDAFSNKDAKRLYRLGKQQLRKLNGNS